MAEIEQKTPFEELCNDLYVAAKNRDIFLENLSSEMSKMISEVEKGTLVEKLHSVLKIFVGDSSSNNLGEMENNYRKLEDRERKLVVRFNDVMSNLYLLPGYVLAVSTGISGLLSSGPHSCGLLVCVMFVVLSFIGALVVAVLFANRQLDSLIMKYEELDRERKALRLDFERLANMSLHISVDAASATAGGRDAAAADGAAKILASYEEVNKELQFQAYCYKKFLLLIIFIGILYAIMLTVAANCVLCDCKAFSVNTIVDQWQWLLTPYL